MAQGFFVSPQGAAELKLAILGRYLSVFASKVGSRAPRQRVCYFDGFAGQGFYDDGTAGSPWVAARAGDIFVNANRNIDGFLVERDPDTFDQLQASAAHWGTWRLRNGAASDHIAEMLDWADGAPLLAFLDPFALGVEWEDLEAVLSRRGTTEVILNVSKHGVRRFAGHLTGKSHAAQSTFVSRVDLAMGGDWWQEIWRADPNDSGARAICSEFCQRASHHFKMAGFQVPVHDRLDGPIDYYLLFLTQHPDGLWEFNNAVSKSLEEVRHAAQAAGASPTLFDNDERYVNEIESNLKSILDSEQPRKELRRNMPEVFGQALGFARQTHVRKALVRLKQQGLIESVPKAKELPSFTLPPA